jgi:hypothetical protein
MTTEPSSPPSASDAAAAHGRPKLIRRTFLIDRGFQLKYSLLLVIAGAVLSGVMGATTYLAHADAWTGINRAFGDLGSAPPADLALQLAETQTTLIWLMVASSVLMAVALGLFGVLLTHRVAGPVYVMSHYLSALAKGRYPTMRPLRKGDELKGFFEQLQGAFDFLRQREAQEAEDLDAAMRRLTSMDRTNETDEVVSALATLRDRKRTAAGEFRPSMH